MIKSFTELVEMLHEEEYLCSDYEMENLMDQIKQIVDLGYKLYASNIDSWFKVPKIETNEVFYYA